MCDRSDSASASESWSSRRMPRATPPPHVTSSASSSRSRVVLLEPLQRRGPAHATRYQYRAPRITWVALYDASVPGIA
eukprot:45354-Rhodomonas_salina.2